MGFYLLEDNLIILFSAAVVLIPGRRLLDASDFERQLKR